MEFLDCVHLHLLVLGASVSEHVHAAAAVTKVSGQVLVLFVSADTIFVIDGVFSLCLDLGLVVGTFTAMMLIRRGRPSRVY